MSRRNRYNAEFKREGVQTKKASLHAYPEDERQNLVRICILLGVPCYDLVANIDCDTGEADGIPVNNIRFHRGREGCSAD